MLSEIDAGVQRRIEAEKTATEALRNQLAPFLRPPRWPGRDAEVIRLHKDGLTPKAIAERIREKEEWKFQENGKPFNSGNVRRILAGARKNGLVK
jgi:hypothetical protein